MPQVCRPAFAPSGVTLLNSAPVSFTTSVCFSGGQSGRRTAPGAGEARGGEESGGKQAGTERRCSGKVQVWLLALVLVWPRQQRPGMSPFQIFLALIPEEIQRLNS